MMNVNGFWFDGQTSKRHQARLQVLDGDVVQVRSSSDNRMLFSSSWDSVTVSDRLGNTPRFISFESGQRFETVENDNIDSFLKQYRGTHASGLLHMLETHWRYVFLTCVIFFSFCWWTYRYALPQVAETLAYQIPDSVLTYVTEETMLQLDEAYFEPSSLSEDTQKRIAEHFQPVIDLYPDLNIKLLFRDGGIIGANAFALPDGTIVFTDQIVKLAENDNQLLAVFAHEIGHVEHRHGMQSVIHGSLFSFILLVWTGDLSATAELILALPVLLTEMAFSREHEHEADHFAYEYLAKSQRTEDFARIMLRLQGSAECDTRLELSLDTLLDNDSEESDKSVSVVDSEEEESIRRCIDKYVDDYFQTGSLAHKGDQSGSWFHYLSTHPATEERIERFISGDEQVH